MMRAYHAPVSGALFFQDDKELELFKYQQAQNQKLRPSKYGDGKLVVRTYKCFLRTIFL